MHLSKSKDFAKANEQEMDLNKMGLVTSSSFFFNNFSFFVHSCFVFVLNIGLDFFFFILPSIITVFCVYYLTSKERCGSDYMKCPLYVRVCSFALVSAFIVCQRSNASDNGEWISNVQPYASLNAFVRCRWFFCCCCKFLYPLSVLNFKSLFQFVVRIKKEKKKNTKRRGETQWLTLLAHINSMHFFIQHFFVFCFYFFINGKNRQVRWSMCLKDKYTVRFWRHIHSTIMIHVVFHIIATLICVFFLHDTLDFF